MGYSHSGTKSVKVRLNQSRIHYKVAQLTMTLSQRKNRYLTRLVLAAVLFAQGILAAHACVEPVAGAALAVSGKQSVETMHCHEAESVNPNECLMHCTQSDQVNLDQHAMAALPANEVVLQLVLPAEQPKVLASSYAPLVLDTGPPLSIRFCSFLI